MGSSGRRARFGAVLAGVSYACLMAVVIPGAALAADAGDVPEPSDYRMQDYRKPVPKTLAGARGVVSADQAKSLQEAGAIFLDVYPRAPKPPNLPASTVWREPPHNSVLGAIWLPNVGYGVLSPQTKSYFDGNLSRLTGGDLTKPLVFFCLRDCWMSWNAAKRAIAGGYSAVYWFSEGTDSWEEHGYPLAVVEPTP